MALQVRNSIMERYILAQRNSQGRWWCKKLCKPDLVTASTGTDGKNGFKSKTFRSFLSYWQMHKGWFNLRSLDMKIVNGIDKSTRERWKFMFSSKWTWREDSNITYTDFILIILYIFLLKQREWLILQLYLWITRSWRHEFVVFMKHHCDVSMSLDS